MNKSYQVEGKSIKELTNIPEGDFLSFSEKEQRSITTRLISAANKRIRRLINSGIDITLKSYASKGKFSIKDLNKKEMLKEHDRVMEFLSRKTSTVRGYKEATKKYKQVATIFDYNEKGEIIRLKEDELPTKLKKDFQVKEGNVWEVVDDYFGESGYRITDKEIVYKFYNKVTSYMNKRQIEKFKDMSSRQKSYLRKLADKYLQGNFGKNVLHIKGNID